MTDASLKESPTPPHLGLPGVVAWLIILLSVAYLIVGNEWPELRGRHAPPKNSPLQMSLLGKSILGTARLAQQNGLQLLTQIDDRADSPDDKIDVAILAGELAGKDEALRRLGKLSATTSPASQPAKVATSEPVASTTSAAASEPLPTPTPLPAHMEPPEPSFNVALLTRLYQDGPGSLSSNDRAELAARDDFFGRLAMNFGKPDIDPDRAAVLHEAVFAAIALYAFLFVVGILALVGLVLLILAIVFYFTGTLKTRYVPQSLIKPVFVEIFAAYLVLFVLGSLIVTRATHGHAGIGITWLLTPVLPLAMYWGVIRGLRWREVLDGLGWFRGRGFWIEMPLGIVGYIAGLPIVGVGLALSLGLMKSTGATPSHPIQNSFATTSPWQLYAIAAVWAPIIEETMFRGALFNHLRRRWSWLISAPIVALIFAAIHPQGLTFIPALGSIALVLAGIREWRGTIISSIVAHGLNNATVVTLMLLTM